MNNPNNTKSFQVFSSSPSKELIFQEETLQVKKISKPTDAASPDDKNTKVLCLRFPAEWFAPLSMIRHPHTIEEETMKWFKEIGVIPALCNEEMVRNIEPR
jgi:hypothetical protein